MMTQRRWRNLTGDGASPTRLGRSGTVMTTMTRPQARTILPTAVTVARALVVARWLTLLWMIGIVVVSSDRHAIDHPLVA